MSYGGLFDVDNKLIEIDKLQSLINQPNFWDDKNQSEKVLNKFNNLKGTVESIKKLKDNITDALDMIAFLKSDYDESLKKELEDNISKYNQDLSSLTLELLLNKEYDKCDCVLDIHPGAGGTESCDWAMMLYRMYTRWCESKGYKIDIIDYQNGEEAGIKSVSIMIHGINAYGFLKCEKGVHRLIRISPFDSNKRRHTSFASVDITPIYENPEFEVKDSDLRIDIYRASGHGGQGVNTTDSAVRITHIPTNTVVTCQNERSQMRNKEIAYEVLKSKLYQLEVERQEKELASIKGQNKEINFGSQIRTYTMHPYSLVKDHRTNCETAQVNKVLDGDIDMFIDESLKRGVV